MANTRTVTTAEGGAPEEIVTTVTTGNEVEELKHQLDGEKKKNEDLIRLITEAKQVKPYLVVIPYKKSETQGNELELSIRCWKEHFKEEFRLCIVGDREDFFDLYPEVVHVSHECTTDNPPLDILAKLQVVIAAFPEEEYIILSNDDIYAVNDFDISDIRFLKCRGMLEQRREGGELYSINRNRTLALLNESKLPTYDYACHLPVFLEVGKLLELIDRFNLGKEPYLIGTLYFNYFFPNRIPFCLDLASDNLKCGVYRSNPDMDIIRQAFKTKIWINNSPAGWIPDLQKLIEEHLPG